MAWLEENWKMDKVFDFDLMGVLLGRGGQKNKKTELNC